MSTWCIYEVAIWLHSEMLSKQETSYKYSVIVFFACTYCTAIKNGGEGTTLELTV